MGFPLRVLLVEDSEDDAELILRQLRKGYDLDARRVASADNMEAALNESAWDVVISDYVMPGFGGLDALRLFHQRALDIPFIVVSGHIGEEIAVSAIKAGADDYLMKDRLARLNPAIHRALEDAQMRRAHKRSNEALRESEERFRQLAEHIGAVFFMFESVPGNPLGRVSYVSPAFRNIWGLPGESLKTSPDLWLKAIHPEDRARVSEKLKRVTESSLSDEFRLQLDLRTRWANLRTFPVQNERGVVYRIAALAEDITERKQVEEQLAANAEQLRNSVGQLTTAQEQLRERNSELLQARAELERRVEERTADLALANRELKDEMIERRRLENELLEIAENERRRIGFDLHDDLGQKLMGVSLLLKALETNLSHKHAPETAETRKIQQLVHQVINHTHNLAHCFSSLEGNGADLCHQLKTLSQNVRKTFQINCSFRAVGSGVPQVASETVQQLCKIAEESISNAVKHGKASRVTLLLVLRDNSVVLRVKNDGEPFPENPDPGDRLGLRIMNYRAHMIGGALEIRSNGYSGTLVTCTVPIIAAGAGRVTEIPTQKSSAEVML